MTEVFPVRSCTVNFVKEQIPVLSDVFRQPALFPRYRWRVYQDQ